MAKNLPKSLAAHFDPASTLNSIRKMADAVERGDLSMSSLVDFVKASEGGKTPSFAVTSPVPVEMLAAIRANPGTHPRQIVYAGVATGRWTYDEAEAFEENFEALSKRSSSSARRDRAVYLTRSSPARHRRPACDGMFVPKTALDIFCRPGLCDGARACLSLILALAGKDDTLVTYTSSLATMLGRTTRTVRNYFTALEEAGLITRRPGRHYNTVRLDISPDCRPAPYQEPIDVRAYKLARDSADPGMHLMAVSLAVASFDMHRDQFATSDRRKLISPFNLDSKRRVEEIIDTLRSKRNGHGVRKQLLPSVSPPTSHSTLHIDPRSPIRNDRRLFAGLRA